MTNTLTRIGMIIAATICIISFVAIAANVHNVLAYVLCLPFILIIVWLEKKWKRLGKGR